MLTAKKTKYRRTLDSVTCFSSAIGKGTTIRGHFSGAENIIVQGMVKGDSDIDGAVVITESGSWCGTLVADLVIVAGRVEGDISAREKLEILDGGHVIGNLHSPVVAIEVGAIHEGMIQMQTAESVTEFSEKRSTSPLTTAPLLDTV